MIGAMQTLKGKGKIYDTGENLISDITYNISCKSPGAEWWGEIVPGNGIIPVGSYIIELEDGRRGPVNVSMRTNSSFGLVVDSFDIRGTGPLKH